MGSDLFVSDYKDSLITVDYFSNFWEIDYLADNKSTTGIKTQKVNLACQGNLDSVISYSGPQYVSQDLEKFCRKWGFQHVTSSPG